MPPVAPGAEEIRVGKSDPDPSCQELQPLEAVHGDGCGDIGDRGTYTGAYNTLRNMAQQIHAHYVRMDQQVPPHSENGCFDDRYVIRAVAYRCL